MFSSRHIIVAMLILLTGSAPVFAMTVYDVVQLSKKGYSDHDIIALIDTTDSAFDIEAGDIPRLMELGVSEPVIQLMLSVEPAPPPADFVPGNGPAAHSVLVSDKQPPPSNLIPRAQIRSEELHEDGAGGHHHHVLSMSGIRLFVLRDEAGYQSVEARADAVAARLAGASAADGEFRSAHVAGRDAVIFNAHGSLQEIVIVLVSSKDAIAYQRRSGRTVTADTLAAYWRDLLSDYWSIALESKAPNHLAMLHEGEALQELFEGLDRSIDNSADRLGGAFRALPKKEQQHLMELAVSVPRDFEADDDHAQEAAEEHTGDSL